MENQDNFTSGEMMAFLRGFQASMETKIGDTKNSIEITNEKIGKRLDSIDNEVRETNKKIELNERKAMEINTRMNNRLTELESEMKRSELIQKKSSSLKNKEKALEVIIDASTCEIVEKGLKVKNIGDKVKDKRIDKVEKITNVILNEPEGTFRSSWALGIQKELQLAAEAANKDPLANTSNDIFENVIEWEEDEPTPIHWEDRFDTEDTTENIIKRNKPNTKIRRPPLNTATASEKVKNEWFGLSSESEDSEVNENWTNIERKRKKQERQGRAADRKSNLKKEVSSRAANMVSLGPLSWNSVEFFKNKTNTFEDAKIQAVKEYLSYNLNYEDDECENLKIAETRMSNREDIMNIAFVNEEDVKELYMRKAESRNENLILRNYIPPNFHQRYMAINKICSEKRSENQNLKTQLRFGKKDIEVYIKYKQEETGFKKVDLAEFTDKVDIPQFDHTIKWRKYNDKPPRRHNNQWTDKGQRPSTMTQRSSQTRVTSRESDPSRQKKPEDSLAPKSQKNDTENHNNQLKRANSNTITSHKTRQKLYSADSSAEDDDMGDTADNEASNEAQL